MAETPDRDPLPPVHRCTPRRCPLGRGAVRRFKPILTLHPGDALASFGLGQICAYTGRYDEGCDAAARAYEVAGTTQTAGALTFVEAMAGRVESAEARLEALTSDRRFVANSQIAAVHVASATWPSRPQL